MRMMRNERARDTVRASNKNMIAYTNLDDTDRQRERERENERYERDERDERRRDL